MLAAMALTKMWMRACLGACLLGCGAASGGGGGAQGASGEAVSLDPAAFLREVGAETSEVLRPPEGSLEELEAVRREARGAERRAATQRVITAHAFAAEEASAADDARGARRHRRIAERLADAAVRGTRDADLVAQVNFMRLWMTWRSGAAAAEGRAERYTTRHTQAGVLTTIAWMIRGEIAFEN